MLDKFKQFCKSYVPGRQSKFTTNFCSTVDNNGSPLTVTHAAIYGDLLKMNVEVNKTLRKFRLSY